MPDNNILLFDQNKSNIMSDQNYSTNAQRLNGVQQGVASSQLQNKTLYQVSLVAYALAQLMNANGYDASDADQVSTFASNMSLSIMQKVLDKATSAEAQAGLNDVKWMSPAKVKEAINALTKRTFYGVCSTATNVLEKAVTVDESFVLEVGAVVNIKFTNRQQITTSEGVSNNITINVNNTGAISVWRNANDWWEIEKDTIHTFVYNGESWFCVSGMPNSFNRDQDSKYTLATSYALRSVSYFKNVSHGEYIGTGNAGNRAVCGFQPNFFIIVPEELSGAYNGVQTIMYVNGRGAFEPKEHGDSGFTTYPISRYYNGIELNGQYMNVNGKTYHFHAFW